jgi:hypothetical protein
MVVLGELNPNIRSKLIELFERNQKVDLSIDSIIAEGQTGRNISIIVDNLLNPKVVQLSQGTFTMFAGDTKNEVAFELVRKLSHLYWIMPCSEEWLNLIKDVHDDKLVQSERYSFSGERLEKSHLIDLIENNPFKEMLCKIDMEMANKMAEDELNKYHFMNYNSPEHFINTGFGYCVKIDNKIVSACSCGLICKVGAEICIITHPDYREKDLATLTAAKFILNCLDNGLVPHWDAATPKSVGIAKKLGYTYVGSYNVYHI